MGYYSVIKKEWTYAVCNKMDGLVLLYAKWNKSYREGQIPFDITYM